MWPMNGAGAGGRLLCIQVHIGICIGIGGIWKGIGMPATAAPARCYVVDGVIGDGIIMFLLHSAEVNGVDVLCYLPEPPVFRARLCLLTGEDFLCFEGFCVVQCDVSAAIMPPSPF